MSDTSGTQVGQQEDTTSIVLQLRDEMAIDRARVRQTLMWLISFLTFATLASVIIVLAAGIAMLRQTGSVLDGMDWLEGQITAHTLELGALSNRVNQVARAQLDVASRVNSLQISQQQTLDQVRSDTEKHTRWIATRELQIERDRMSLDTRWQQRGEALDELVASLARVREQVEGIVVFGNEVVGVAEHSPAEGLVGTTGVALDRPAWASLLDSFEGHSLSNLMEQVLLHVEDGEAPTGVSRTISVVQFPNGDRYEGSFENGLMQGWGIYTYRNGDRYEGHFYHDLRHGNGTLTKMDGSRYAGGFVRGIRQGLGSLVQLDGMRYAGEFGNDMINGRGIMVYPDGSQYAGDFLNGHRHGHGVHRFVNGDFYNGEFRQDMRTGTGLYAFADGSEYEGGFVDGVRHGRGHYRFADGSAFIGTFRDGKMHGEGLRIVNGTRIRGVWHEGDHLRDLQE